MSGEANPLDQDVAALSAKFMETTQGKRLDVIAASMVSVLASAITENNPDAAIDESVAEGIKQRFLAECGNARRAKSA